MKLTGAILAAAVLTLAGCSSNGSATLTASHSHDAGNVRVCDHYRTQRAWVKNLAEPTVADALKFETWVAVDAAQAARGTPVARDLSALSQAQRNPRGDVYATSKRVVQACEALGVKFQP